MSLVLKEDLVVKYIGAGSDGGTEGVIRKSAFRIMGERADIEWSVSLSTDGMVPLPPRLALTSHPHHSIFVSRLFDQPEIEKFPSEAVEILNETTSYAFAGQEELKFIDVYKETSDPILDDPAE